MQKILYFDFCAMAVYLTLLLGIVMRGMTKTKLNRYFVYVVADCIIATVADIYAIHFDNIQYDRIALRYVYHTVYLISHNLSTPLYIMYLISLADTWHKYAKKGWFLFGSFPFVVSLVMLLENIFVKNVFYINENRKYVRGNLFFILYVSAFFYIVVGVYMLIKYRKLFRRRQFVSLTAVFPLMIAAVVGQYLKPNVPMEMFANALALLFILLFVQSAEDYLDANTGYGNLDKYVHDIRNGSVNDKSVHIVMINIVNYDSVRDVIGYEKTMGLLKVLGDTILSACEKNQMYMEGYYLGNGKFRLILEQKYFNKTEFIAQKVNEVLKEDIVIGQMSVNVTACVCVTKYPEDISDVESLLDFGKDLSGAKYNGAVLYASDIYQKKRYDLMKNMDTIIEQALTAHEFEVYYQPIYSVKEKRFKSAEALLRLKSKEYGFVSPEIFIPAAEASGSIHRIGSFVLEEVCSFISSDEFEKLGVDYIEVNLSVVQCMRANLAKEILDIMRRYHVSPAQLNLEITETAASYSQNTLMENIEELTQNGVYFSLDDYGTGYSNMKRIATMPFKLVKLDKSFTDLDNERFRIVLQNTIQMIKDMQMEIVVEGIETAELVEQFSRLSCEYIQGYYFSRPLPKNDYIAFVREKHAS